MILILFFFFFFRKILISVSRLFSAFVFFFRRILISFTCLFSKLFFVFFVIFIYRKKNYKKYFCEVKLALQNNFLYFAFLCFCSFYVLYLNFFIRIFFTRIFCIKIRRNFNVFINILRHLLFLTTNLRSKNT